MEGKQEIGKEASQTIQKNTEASGLRIFISGCNTLLGYNLIEELRNDHIEDEGKANLFVGTLNCNDSTNPPPSNVKRVVSYSKLSKFTKVLLDCDVIIYNIQTAEPDEIRYATTSIYYKLLFHRVP